MKTIKREPGSNRDSIPTTSINSIINPSRPRLLSDFTTIKGFSKKSIMVRNGNTMKGRANDKIVIIPSIIITIKDPFSFGKSPLLKV